MTTPPPHPDALAHWAAVFEALDGLGCGLLMVADRGGVFERWYTSQSAASLLGVTVEDAQRLSLLDPIADEERPRLEQMRAQLLAGLDTPSTFETVIKRPDGGRTPVEVSLSKATIPGGYLTVALLRDIGGRHASQSQMLEAERMAVIGAIAAGVAHEINNPLTYVLLHLRTLRRSLARWNADPEMVADADRLLLEAEGGADRVRVIVRDLLALARGHADADGTIDVDQVVEGAVRLIAPSMQHRARVISERTSVPSVPGDETRLAHAVLSMLLFAGAGFSTDDPSTNTIEVKVDAIDGAVRIQVSDNGENVAPDRMARAFEPFFAPRGGGPGSGLAVAHGVAVALGGTATLSARDGGGAIMRMTLPVPRRRPR